MKKFIGVIIPLIFALSSSLVYSQKKSDDQSKEKEAPEAQNLEWKEAKEQAEQYRVIARDRAVATGRAAATSYSFGDGVYVINTSGGSSSQLSLSKTFNGESKKNEGSFDVDKSVRNINLSLSGKVKTGSIKIKITLSNGDLIKELSIDESADIQYNQNIKIADDEDKYYGKWNYSVESVKAEGTYHLSLNTH